jgi:hypothetical protein
MHLPLFITTLMLLFIPSLASTTNHTIGCLELVQFSSITGATEADVAAAAESVEGLLRAQPGFMARLLTSVGNASYIDAVHWRSLQDALAAAKVVERSPLAKRFLAIIDPASVRMSHSIPILQDN